MEYKYLLSIQELAQLTGKTNQETQAFFQPNELIEINRLRTAIKPEAVKKFLTKKHVQYNFKAIAHINLRGGIGKTTSAVTMASRAAQYGFRTCILDLDPQGSASFTFNILKENQEETIFYDGWQKPKEILIPALKQIQPGFSILPSALENAMLDTALLNPTNLKKAVRNTVEAIQEAGYDLVIMDCSPSLGAGTISAICGSTDIVIPVWGDYFSSKGLELTLREIDSIMETFSLQKPDIHILFTKYDKREKINVNALKQLKQKYPNTLLKTHIRVNSEISKAFEENKTVFANFKRNTAREDYDAYTRKLLNIKSKSKTKTKQKQ